LEQLDVNVSGVLKWTFTETRYALQSLAQNRVQFGGGGLSSQQGFNYNNLLFPAVEVALQENDTVGKISAVMGK
jgi:hypothetical protein